MRRRRSPSGALAMALLGEPHELKLPTVQEANLSNGLRVISAERHEIPVVNFWLESEFRQFASDDSVCWMRN